MFRFRRRAESNGLIPLGKREARPPWDVILMGMGASIGRGLSPELNPFEGHLATAHPRGYAVARHWVHEMQASSEQLKQARLRRGLPAANPNLDPAGPVTPEVLQLARYVQDVRRDGQTWETILDPKSQAVQTVGYREARAEVFLRHAVDEPAGMGVDSDVDAADKLLFGGAAKVLVLAWERYPVDDALGSRVLLVLCWSAVELLNGWLDSEEREELPEGS